MRGGSHHPSWPTPTPPTRVARPKEAPACPRTLPSPAPRSAPRDRPRRRRRLRARRRARAGRLLQRPRDRAAGHRRDPLDRPRTRSRRHPLLPLCDDRGRDPRRPQPLARDVLQGGVGGPRPRRRQGRDHRRPDEGQDRGAAPRLRAVRPGHRRPLLHRVRRGHLLRGHGRRGAGVLLRHRPDRRPRRRRRLVGADGVRRLPGDARQCRGAVGRSDPRPAALSASPASARWGTTWSSTSSTTARRSW